ncbi:hypothetical protein [Streptomyces sp. NPDC020681]|uniref:hypothetical protein n=1 Tax=Streptomyces sp. NPDC020681 TaxID=3365083 RepID=UPI0037A0CBA0
MAANRKFLVSAMVCATVLAGLAGCSKENGTKVKSSSEEKAGEPAAPTTTKPPANPFEGLTADQIAEKAVAATKGAQSLRMAGRIKTDGETMDAEFAADTKGACTGKIGMQGGTAELLQVNKVTYMKGDEKFWRYTIGEEGGTKEEVDAGVELIKGRWMKLPADSAKDMGGTCDLKSMLEDMADEEFQSKGLTKGPDADVNGQPVATVVKKKAGETTTLYVAKEGEPYILKVVVVGGDEPGSMVFSDYNQPVKAVAPPAGEVVDAEKLGGGPGANSNA